MDSLISSGAGASSRVRVVPRPGPHVTAPTTHPVFSAIRTITARPRTSGLQDLRTSGLQDFRTSGLQDFRTQDSGLRTQDSWLYHALPVLSDSAHLLVRAWRHRLIKDRWEIALVRSSLRPGDCCLDIGSHKGAYAYWMAKRVGPTGLVAAFEPQPNYAAMQRRLWQYRGCTQVRVEELALSDHTGSATLYLPSWGPSPGASLARSSLGAEVREVTVPMTTLDLYAKEHTLPRVAFIKCDVEGHELSVFKGGEAMLRRDKPRLLFECEARFGGETRVREVFAFLESLGYQGWFMLNGRRTPTTDFRDATHQPPNAKHSCNNFVFEPV